MRKLFDRYRRKLANYESLGPYAVIGIIGGLASGLVVLGFELAISELALLWTVKDHGEGFEALPRWAQFAVPAAGALTLGLLYTPLKPEDRETGIVHVLSRMHSHYGALPLRNAMLQFFGGALALATGQSGGREGPSVHLGGAVNSLLGQRLGLPNTSLRVLIACGTAGGISAAFHTPLAGVIFAMEVIIAEYTVVGFIPVILAAVSAAAVSRTLSGEWWLPGLSDLELQSLLEIPYIVLLGCCCGVAAAAFIFLTRRVSRLQRWPVLLRFTLAGCITGAVALWVPEIMGMGYDTLQRILGGEVGLAALCLIGISKLLATSISSGAGLPIGVIGPSLFVGACIGGAMGMLGHQLYPEHSSGPVLYIALGMGATMAAVLNAPLAAMLALIELTRSMSLAMPAMLAIVAATLTNSVVFRQRSAHQTALRDLQRAVPDDALSKMLHRTDVTSIMDPRAVRVPASFQPEHLEPLLEYTPHWCVVAREERDLYLVDGAELLSWLGKRTDPEQDTDLTEADIRRWTLAPVPVQATLYQAMDAMRSATAEAVAIYERSTGSGKMLLHGVLSREDIEKHYLSRL